MGIRELRNQAAAAVRRARAGERIVITVDGTPAAQLVPLNVGLGEATLEDMVAAGLVEGPRSRRDASPPSPVSAPGSTSTEVLRRHRQR